MASASQKQHPAALKHFFDVCVTRHAIGLNPAVAMRGRKLQVVEGKTLPVSIEQARLLLRSIATATWRVCGAGFQPALQSVGRRPSSRATVSGHTPSGRLWWVPGASTA